MKTLPVTALLLSTSLPLTALPARANLVTLAASGTISVNTTADPTLPVNTPWSFTLTYNTAAPDQDSQGGGSPDPTFGQFTNTSTPPALVAFHYKAGSYEVTLNNPADFGPNSAIDITFTTVNAIDININAATLFPHLAGGPVSFHADFNAFSTAPIFSSDTLPANTNLTAASFDQSSITLLPPSGVIIGSTLTTFSLAVVPEPSTAAVAIIGILALLRPSRKSSRTSS